MHGNNLMKINCIRLGSRTAVEVDVKLFIGIAQGRRFIHKFAERGGGSLHGRWSFANTQRAVQKDSTADLPFRPRLRLLNLNLTMDAGGCILTHF